MLAHQEVTGCRGLLIRGGDVLEAASHTDTVIFDKTGTLTRGKPSIRSITPATSDLSEQDILAFAACVERQTSHPVAHAIVSASDAQGGSLSAISKGHLYLCVFSFPASIKLFMDSHAHALHSRICSDGHSSRTCKLVKIVMQMPEYLVMCECSGWP